MSSEFKQNHPRLHFACKSTEQGQIEPDQLTSITLKVKRINA